VAPALVDYMYVRSSPGMHWDELRRAQHGAARVEFALMVAIFVTWIIVSVAMFQQGVREVYTGATGAVAAAGTPPTTGGPTTPAARTASTATAAPTPSAPTTAPATASVPTTQAPAPTVTVTVMPAPAQPAAAPAAAPAVPAPPLTAPTRQAPTKAPPTTSTPTRTAPTTAPPTTAPPTTAAPVEAPADAAPPAAAPTPPQVAPTTSAPAPEPVAGPRLVLTAAIAKKGTLAANLLSGLSQAATLAGIGVTSGRGELAWSTANGDYVFNAPGGKDTTVITFTYTQGSINVTGNTLTISTE
jgi:Flp pilus assembly pilin Flp